MILNLICGLFTKPRKMAEVLRLFASTHMLANKETEPAESHCSVDCVTIRPVRAVKQKSISHETPINIGWHTSPFLSSRESTNKKSGLILA